MKQHVFIVDDDKDALAEMAECVEDEGFRVSRAGSAEDMWKKIKRDPCHLLLLDIRLPGESGLSITRKVRSESKVGIIFISGKANAIDRIVGLEMGADDYIVKPFTPQEVAVRIKRVLSRTNQYTYPAPQPSPCLEQHTLCFEGWTFQLGSYCLLNPAQQEVPLTTAEFNLLKLFVLSPHRILSRDYLLGQIHHHEWVGYDRGIDGLVSRLRKKLSCDQGSNVNIKTIRGLGYMLTSTVITSSDGS